MSATNYIETFERDGFYRWKIYHYDETGNREIIISRSSGEFGSRSEAVNDATDWIEDNHPNIEYETA